MPKCDGCGAEIPWEPYVSNIDGTDRYFCCWLCQRSSEAGAKPFDEERFGGKKQEWVINLPAYPPFIHPTLFPITLGSVGTDPEFMGAGGFCFSYTRY